MSYECLLLFCCFPDTSFKTRMRERSWSSNPPPLSNLLLTCPDMVLQADQEALRTIPTGSMLTTPSHAHMTFPPETHFKFAHDTEIMVGVVRPPVHSSNNEDPRGHELRPL